MVVVEERKERRGSSRDIPREAGIRFVSMVELGGIEEHGFGAIANSIAEGQRALILNGIDESLTHTWYLAVGLGCTTIVGSLLVEWRSVKQKQS